MYLWYCVIETLQEKYEPSHFWTNCSQGTFIKQKLLEEIGIEGSKTKLSIQTIVGQSTEDCYAVEGLSVAPDEDRPNTWIDLPTTYTQEQIPVNENEIPAKGDLDQWKYLKTLQGLNPATNVKGVGLLIGANCPKALEPREVIHSEENGPYAYRTILGWCVVGTYHKKCY